MATAQEIIDGLTAEAAEDVTVMQGATRVINGISYLVTAAVAAALANGATEAQLAPLTEVQNTLSANRLALSEAIATTPPANP